MTQAFDTIGGITNAVGRAVSGRRQHYQLPIEAISSSTGIGVKTLSLVEDGKTDIQIDHLLKVLHSTGLDMRLPRSKTGVPPEKLVHTRLKEIRRAIVSARRAKDGHSKISLRAISETSGIEQGQIGEIIRGHIPRIRTLLALLQALNIPVKFVNLENFAPPSAEIKTVAKRVAKRAAGAKNLAANPATVGRARRKATAQRSKRKAA